MDPRFAYGALTLVILAWGSGPVVAKLITVPAAVGALLRFGISIPVLFAIVYLTGRRVSGATMRAGLAPGLAFGVNLTFVFLTVQEATVAVLAVAVTLQPAVILIVTGPLFGERATRTHVAWTIAAIGGAAVVILGAGSELQSSAAGVFYALAAMATFTVYFVMTRLARLHTAVDPIEWMASINVWSFVATIPAAMLTTSALDYSAVDRRDWWWLAVMAYVTGVFGHVLMSWVHGFVEASRSSLALLAMNIVAVGLAWPVHDESVTWAQAAGGVIVLAAVAAVLRVPPATTDARPVSVRG